ncbi:MAG: hypothetical protein U0521_21560 [Anaerolineae bacterium]
MLPPVGGGVSVPSHDPVSPGIQLGQTARSETKASDEPSGRPDGPEIVMTGSRDVGRVRAFAPDGVDVEVVGGGQRHRQPRAIRRPRRLAVNAALRQRAQRKDARREAAADGQVGDVQPDAAGRAARLEIGEGVASRRDKNLVAGGGVKLDDLDAGGGAARRDEVQRSRCRCRAGGVAFVPVRLLVLMNAIIGC